MRTRIQPKRANTETVGYYFYDQREETGLFWVLGFRDLEGGTERFLLSGYLVRENNRGWTMELSDAIATGTVNAFLSRGEWELVEV